MKKQFLNYNEPEKEKEADENGGESGGPDKL
jgi:hypothetical protein